MNKGNKFISIIFLIVLFLLDVFIFCMHNTDISKICRNDFEYNSLCLKAVEGNLNKFIYDTFVKNIKLIKEIDSVIKYLLCRHVYNQVSKVIEENNFDMEKFIKWACVDINVPFFKLENNSFYIQREDILLPRNEIKKYLINKEKNKKRIFILGESVARLYPENILEKELLKYFDDVDVINAGIGAYDSFRIEKISEEILKFKPDYVILFIGSNDGISECYFDVQIDSCIEKNFQKNILKIIENLKNTNIIFCDLPNNEYCIGGNIDDGIKYNISKKMYYEKIWKNSVEYSHLVKRIDFLKQISKKYNNVYITNLTDVLRDYTDDELGYNVFHDAWHFEDTTYLLLSKLITQIIVKKENNLELNLDLSKQEYSTLLMYEIEKFIDLKKLQELSTYLGGDNYLSIYNKFEALYKLNKEAFYNECKIAYEEFLRNNIEDDTNYKIMLFYADVLQNNKDINKAEEILNKMIMMFPSKFESYLILGYIKYKNNNLEEANKYFSKAKKINKNIDIDVVFLNKLSKEN